MTDHQLAQRGEEAKRLIENELLVEAFKTLEQEYTQAWKQTKASDEAGREKLWMAINQLQMLMSHLSSVIQTGKVAENKLQKAQKSLEAGLKRWRE
jgi:ribosome-binding ATPase YchF (GTP1/OBG family)